MYRIGIKTKGGNTGFLLLIPDTPIIEQKKSLGWERVKSEIQTEQCGKNYKYTVM